MKKQIILLFCSLFLMNGNFLRAGIQEDITNVTAENVSIRLDELKNNMEYVEWIERDGDKRVIALESPMLTLIDGKSFGVNGVVFGLLLQIRKDVRGCVWGQPVQGGGRLGTYTFEGDRHSAISLAKIECQYEIEYCIAKYELIKNKLSYGAADWKSQMEAVEKLYSTRKRALKEVLEQAKDNFLELSKSYVESARGTKEQTNWLIKESCEKRGRSDCIILQWGEAEEGKENEILKKQVLTFKDFAQFCYDLANFLEDMARSCKEGQKQFREMISIAKRKK